MLLVVFRGVVTLSLVVVKVFWVLLLVEELSWIEKLWSRTVEV